MTSRQKPGVGNPIGPRTIEILLDSDSAAVSVYPSRVCHNEELLIGKMCHCGSCLRNSPSPRRGFDHVNRSKCWGLQPH